MQIRDVKNILDAEVLSGEELLDTEVRAACDSDMMSDVLAYVKDQAVLLTGLCVSIANNQNASGKATNEEIGTLAVPIQKFIIDPFTGDPPRINNSGNGKFLVISAGPDGVFEQGEMKIYSSRFGLSSSGDIYLQRK